jgi:hypothetical protein
MVRSYEREGWSGGKLDLVWTSLVCIDDSARFLKAWMCLSRFSFLVIFRAISWWFSWSDFEAFLFGIWWGMYAWTLRGSFPFDYPPKSMSKGARFWDFLGCRVRGVLGGISSIPLDLSSFGGPNLGYGVPMRCSYYPKSLAQIRGAIPEIGSWIWGCWPAGAVHPKSSGHTGLTSSSHRSNRCRLSVEFCSGEHLGEFPIVLCYCCFEFDSFWSSGGQVCVLGLRVRSVWPTYYTGLTGVGAFCGSSQNLSGCSNRDRWPVCATGQTGVA